MKYYNTSKIDKLNCTYNVIFGERSNGKTYALLHKSLVNYNKDGSQFGYVRRWKTDITGRRAQQLFSGINDNDEVNKITNGKFKGVHYWAGKFYLCNYDECGKPVYAVNDLIGYTFSLSDTEHDKSTSFPNIKTVIFDEFLTKTTYFPDEFVFFMNTISTIVRRREDVIIYMLGNTVNKYCPYFSEMGLIRVKEQKQGSIDVYTYGNSTLKIAVEYCKSQTSKEGNKITNRYFAFDNPKLQMITGGSWELDIYPHLPIKFKPKDIMLSFFIVFGDNMYQCEVVCVNDVSFIYIHDKTTELKNPDEDLIYSRTHNPRINHNRNLLKPINSTQKKILWFFANSKVFYQDNTVGDAVTNYLKVCKGNK